MSFLFWVFWTAVKLWLVCGFIAAWRGRHHGGALFWVLAGPIGLLIQLAGTL